MAGAELFLWFKNSCGDCVALKNKATEILRPFFIPYLAYLETYATQVSAFIFASVSSRLAMCKDQVKVFMFSSDSSCLAVILTMLWH